MTVKELITELQACKQNDLVILASDETGGVYNQLSFISTDENYDQDGEMVYSSEELAEMKEDGEYVPKTKSCIVLCS